MYNVIRSIIYGTTYGIAIFVFFIYKYLVMEIIILRFISPKKKNNRPNGLDWAKEHEMWHNAIRAKWGDNKDAWMMVSLSGYFERCVSDGYGGEITIESLQSSFADDVGVNLSTSPICQEIFAKWVKAGLLLHPNDSTYIIADDAIGFNKLEYLT